MLCRICIALGGLLCSSSAVTGKESCRLWLCIAANKIFKLLLLFSLLGRAPKGSRLPLYLPAGGCRYTRSRVAGNKEKYSDYLDARGKPDWQVVCYF